SNEISTNIKHNEKFFRYLNYLELKKELHHSIKPLTSV
ncbi:unnamed protein product, partial [Rotaria sordida]